MTTKILRANKNLTRTFLTRRNLRCVTNYGVQYSQSCKRDECDCLIEEPKCKKRPEVVREVDCEKCIFECWEYKPRPKFAPAKRDLKTELKLCCPTMQDVKERTLIEEKRQGEKCQYMNRVEAPIGCCPKMFKGKFPKPCKENPYKFEDENIPISDWDFKKKPEC